VRVRVCVCVCAYVHVYVYVRVRACVWRRVCVDGMVYVYLCVSWEGEITRLGSRSASNIINAGFSIMISPPQLVYNLDLQVHCVSRYSWIMTRDCFLLLNTIWICQPIWRQATHDSELIWK